MAARIIRVKRNKAQIAAAIISKPFKAIGDLPHRIRCMYQRSRKGYCEDDVYQIDTWFLNTVSDILEDFRNQKHISIPEKIKTEAKDLNASEDELWNKKLDEMIFLLKQGLNSDCSEKNEFEEEYRYLYVKENGIIKKKENAKEITDRYFARAKQIDEYKKECVSKGLNMLAEYFRDLNDWHIR